MKKNRLTSSQKEPSKPRISRLPSHLENSSEKSDILQFVEPTPEEPRVYTRPWVNVKPAFPWRQAIAIAAVVAVAFVLWFVLKPQHNDAAMSVDPAQLSAEMPQLGRRGEITAQPLDATEAQTTTEVKATTQAPSTTGAKVTNQAQTSTDDAVESGLKTLILKVQGNHLRANGELIDLGELNQLLNQCTDTVTLKLINRSGEPKLVETVLNALEQSSLHYQFVVN